MKKNRLILGTISFLIITSCGTKTIDDKLIGHWHRVPTDDWTYQTLDIDDTVTITDKYNIFGGQYFEYPRTDNNNKQILPSDIYKHSNTFSLINDTLSILGNTQTYRFVKSDLTQCLISDRYVNCHVNISLTNFEPADKFDVSFKKFCSDDIFIGKLRPNSDFRDSLSRVFTDSIFIQREDVLIKLSDIPELCKHINNLCSHNKNPLNINLHADNSVPDEFIKQIELLIPDTFTIHRIVKLNNKDIGLKQIR